MIRYIWHNKKWNKLDDHLLNENNKLNHKINAIVKFIESYSPKIVDDVYRQDGMFMIYRLMKQIDREQKVKK